MRRCMQMIVFFLPFSSAEIWPVPSFSGPANSTPFPYIYLRSTVGPIPWQLTATAMKTWKSNGVLLRNRSIHGEFTVVPSSENRFMAVIVEPRTVMIMVYTIVYSLHYATTTMFVFPLSEFFDVFRFRFMPHTGRCAGIWYRVREAINVRVSGH